MVIIAYGEQDRPIQRIAGRMAAALESRGYRASTVSAEGLPGIISRSRGVRTLIGAWWRALVPVIADIETQTQVIACVYDCSTYKARDFPAVAERADIIFAANDRLRAEAVERLEAADITTPVHTLTDGVDAETFTPGDEHTGPIRIGWCGDTRGRRGEIKRLPMLRSACSALDGVELRVAQRLPAEAMPDWYRGLDIIACASDNEGTPNPILEGAAAGLPYIATPVGTVPDLHAQTAGGWVADGTNTREGIIDAIREALALGRPGLRSIGLRNRAAVVEGWAWEKRLQGILDAVEGKPLTQPQPTVQIPTKKKSKLPPRRPRVAVVFDQAGWAFHGIAERLKEHLGQYEVETVAYPDLPKLGRYFDGFDACVLLPYFGVDKALKAGAGDIPLIACVYDHYLWRGASRPLWERTLRHAAKVLAANDQLAGELGQCYPQLQDVGLCCDGVDTQTYFPGVDREIYDGTQPLRVGWAGSSRAHASVKGLDLIKEALGNLPGVELVIQDASVKKLPKEAMPDWYRGLDLYVCASLCEGTPNGVLESAGCGIPWVSTPVGIVPDLLASHEAPCGVITPRSVTGIRRAVERLRDDPEALVHLKRATRPALRGWDWSRKVTQFDQAIREVLK